MSFKPLRWARQCISFIGFGAGVGFVSYGAYALRNTSAQTLGITTVAVGGLLTLQSCCMCSMGLYADKRMDRLLTNLQLQNEALRESVGSLNTSIAEQKHENEKHRSLLAESRQNLNVLQEHTEDLRESAAKLSASNTAYQQKLEDNRILCERMEAEIDMLKMHNYEAAERIDELQQLVVEQKEQIEALQKQAKYLNELQRRSVQMIQKLALYGNDCKKFGIELGEVSKQLRETDESLGLTSDEMAAQVRALYSITQALERTDRSLRLHKSGKRKKRRAKSLPATANADDAAASESIIVEDMV